jgi:hypothetical protein
VADGIFEKIGSLAEPLKPAVDFFLGDGQAPPPQPGAPAPAPAGGGFSIGDLFGSLGEGVTRAVTEGPIGLAKLGLDVLNPSSGLSAGERLAYGGMAFAGATGYVGARKAYQNWRSAPELAAVSRGYEDLVDLGDGRRFVERMTPQGIQRMRQLPGVNLQQAEILAATDQFELARALGRFDEGDPRTIGLGSVVARYSAQVAGAEPARALETAQFNLARFDIAVDRGVISTGRNKSLVDLWRKMTNDPDSLLDDPAAQDELFTKITKVAEATSWAENDLSFGPAGRIEQIEFDARGEPVLLAKVVWAWDGDSSKVQSTRQERLYQLNHRYFATQGADNIKRLYSIGKTSWDAQRAGARGVVNLDVGPDWYPQARNQVAEVFEFPRDADGNALPSPDLDRAVAAVSFLSEAQEWTTNVSKAHRALTHPEVVAIQENPEFVQWLKDPKNTPNGPQHASELDRIRSVFGVEGMKLDKKTARVVMRLVGGLETVRDIFRDGNRRKQRNFFLNISRPDLEYPVTIDRHAYDAWVGLDTGVNKRPIDFSLQDGDQVYDLIADSYRQVAEELGVPVHQLQAVVWETWKALKKEPFRTGADGKPIRRVNGWKQNDPFRLPTADGEDNMIYRALNGELNWPAYAAADVNGEVPFDVAMVPNSLKQGMLFSSDGDITLAEVTSEAVAQNLGAYPAVMGEDGVARWWRVVPTIVPADRSLERAAIDEPRAVLVSRLKGSEHPALSVPPGMAAIVLDVPDSAVMTLPLDVWFDIAHTEVVQIDQPDVSFDRLGPEDLQPEMFSGQTPSPLETHSWAAISADLGDDQVARQGRVDYDSGSARNELYSELVRRGYKPIEQQGVYKGGSEPSFLVFGIDATEALELGEMFGQESVLTNRGFVYNRQYARNEPYNVSREVGEDGTLGPAPQQFAQADRVYGQGIESMFSGGKVEDIAPWKTYSRKKGQKSTWFVDQDLLAKARRGDAVEQDVDPRYLYNLQGGLTLEGVQRYVNDPNAAPAPDGGWVNDRPVVYQRANGDRILLSGNHRAAAALVQGRPLRAVLVQEPIRQRTGGIELNIPDEAPFRSEFELAGKRVTWSATDFEDLEGYTDPAELSARSTSAVQRRVVHVPLKGLDEALLTVSRSGAGPYARVYAARSELPGFKRVTESIYTDGVNEKTWLSSNADPGSPNSTWVFVPPSLKVPDAKPVLKFTPQPGEALAQVGSFKFMGANVDVSDIVAPKVDGRTVSTWSMVSNVFELTPGVTPGAYAYVRFGKKPYIELPPDAPVARSRSILQTRDLLEQQLGITIDHLRHDGKQYPFFKQSETMKKTGPSSAKGLAFVANGEIGPPRVKGPKNSEFMREFGVDFPRVYRIGREQFDVDPSVIDGAGEMTARIYETFPSLRNRVRFQGFKVQEYGGKANSGDTYAWTKWELGSEISLNTSAWRDPIRLDDQLERDFLTGHFAGEGRSHIIAHEYGHLIHYTFGLAENRVPSKKQMYNEFWDIDTELIDTVLRGSKFEGATGDLRNKAWKTEAQRRISDYSAVNVAELVAEVIGEVMSSRRPRPLTQELAAIIIERYASAIKYRKVVGF